MNRDSIGPNVISPEEKRRRRQLARVRQVERTKKKIVRIGLGVISLLVLIFLVRNVSRKKETFSEIEGTFSGYDEEISGNQDDWKKSDIQVENTEKRSEYLAMIEEKAAADERYREVLDRQEEYPEIILRICAQNEEALNFVLDYPDKKDSEPASTVGDVTKGQVPLLIQWDRRWGYAPYGKETIVAVSGCGPTCIAMVVCALTGRNDITPAVVAAYSAANGFLTSSRDTSWDLMTYGGNEYGITGTELGLDETAMANQLDAGHPIIASVGPGDFTGSGHFIVLTGYDGAAFSVNDPNSLVRSQETWTFERLKGQIRNLWYYELL